MTYRSPLAELLRPKDIQNFFGQDHLLKVPDGSFYRIFSQKKMVSSVFYGPPGCGKTTLARMYIETLNRPCETIVATHAQTSEIRRIIEKTYENPLLFRPLIVWVDEVHRLSRQQQDLFLQPIEDGSIIFIAATTENPSFELTRALLSRVQVFTLQPLSFKDLEKVLLRVEELHKKPFCTEDAKKALCNWAQGDARALLRVADQIIQENNSHLIALSDLEKILLKKSIGCDPTGEGRYQMISALHKAVRGSDCQAALYWLMRMLTQGEDPLYIARRMIRMASEDIGLAEPQALQMALNAHRAYEILGTPEGELAIAEALIFLALCPKSNASYVAFSQAKEHAEKTPQFMPPKHIVNAPTPWMKNEGFGKGYVYDPDTQDSFSGQSYFPQEVAPCDYYKPALRGFERELQKRLNYFQKLKTKREQNDL